MPEATFPATALIGEQLVPLLTLLTQRCQGEAPSIDSLYGNQLAVEAQGEAEQTRSIGYRLYEGLSAREREVLYRNFDVLREQLKETMS